MGLNFRRDRDWRSTYLGVPIAGRWDLPGRKHRERGYMTQGSIHRWRTCKEDWEETGREEAKSGKNPRLHVGSQLEHLIHRDIMVDLVQLALVVLTSDLFLSLLGGFAASPREDPRQTGWKYPRALGNEQNRAWLDFWEGTASSGQAEVDSWIALLSGRILQRLEWGREPHMLKRAPDYHLSSCHCVQQ